MIEYGIFWDGEFNFYSKTEAAKVAEETYYSDDTYIGYVCPYCGTGEEDYCPCYIKDEDENY